MYLSVVIPSYNEEERILSTLSEMHKFLSGKVYDYEVIIVDDGSSDGTVGETEKSELFREGKARVVSYEENKGKGYAVKTGILESKGEYVLVCDADMSTPIEEVERLVEVTGEGHDIVIGSRGMEASEVRIHQPWYREKMGKVFNLFVTTLLMGGFKDTQCGFKLFKGDVARLIAQKLKIDGFCFDVEMLYLANKLGYSVKEMGVIWNNSPHSKVEIIDSSVGMFFDLFKIKRLHG